MLVDSEVSEKPGAAAGVEATDCEYLSTSQAAKAAGFTEATLRNYAWLMTFTAEARAERLLQAPPDGLPLPKRVRGRLRWPKAEMLRFAEMKQK